MIEYKTEWGIPCQIFNEGGREIGVWMKLIIKINFKKE